MTEWSLTNGQNLREISNREFVEPIDLCVDERRQRLYVADTGAGRVFILDLGSGQLLRSFAAPAPAAAAVKKSTAVAPAPAAEPLTAITLGLNGELLVACGATVKIFDGATGRFLRDLWSFGIPKISMGANSL